MGPWLRLSYALARPLARAGAAPDLVTLAGLVVAATPVALAAAGGRRWLLLGAAAVVLSGLLDNLDGAVAILRDRVSAWGYLLDSVADRIADLLYVLALWTAGAPVWPCVLGGALMFLHEYARARAVGAGVAEVGVVTVWERGTRVVVTAMFLLGGGLFPADADQWASLGAWAWVGLGVIGLVQLAKELRKRLR